MGMPRGDTPQKAHDYYVYLQGHQQTLQEPATWHIRWLDLAWFWGFMIAISVGVLLWVWQYRSTRQRGIYQADTFGGYTTELAGPATLFFVVFTVFVTGFGIVMVVGHIIWGQKF
jgi:hypothetical protein